MLLIIFLPSQLGYHWPFSFSFVMGYLVTYYIPTLYLTDVLLLLLVFLWLGELVFIKNARQNLILLISSNKFLFLSLILFLIVAFPNANTLNFYAALISWGMWWKGLVIFLFVISHLSGKYMQKAIYLGFSILILKESFVAIMQFLTQHSLFPYYILGETNLASPLGIASGNFLGFSFLRAYGTTPHPNILGGMLVLALLFVQNAIKKSEVTREKVFLGLVLVFGILAIFTTFSRTAYLAFVISQIIVISKDLKKTLIIIASAIPVSFLLVSYYFGALFGWPSWLAERLYLSKIALGVIREQFFLGVGLNNFILALQEKGGLAGDYRFLQPVHNVFLLLMSEIGLLGLLPLTLFFRFLLRDTLTTFSISLLSALFVLGMGDHFLITFQGGILLLFISLGCIFSLHVAAGVNLGNEG